MSRTKEQVLNEVTLLLEELGWYTILLMQQDGSIPAILSGTSEFIGDTQSMMERANLGEVINPNEVVEKTIVEEKNPDLTSKKKTFH